MSRSLLDPGQIIKDSFDEANHAIQVRSIAQGLVNIPYDQIDLTYVASGNGTGEIQTAIFKLANTTVATLTMSYNVANKLSSVVRS